MAAIRKDVDHWIETALKEGNRIIISVCDTFDYEDYPVYCKDVKELLEKHCEFDGVNMQKVNEIITISENGIITTGLNIYAFREYKK